MVKRSAIVIYMSKFTDDVMEAKSQSKVSLRCYPAEFSKILRRKIEPLNLMLKFCFCLRGYQMLSLEVAILRCVVEGECHQVP